MNTISVVINTLNEEKNLPRAIASVKGLADEIVVVDMESDDATVEVAKKLGAKVFTHKRTGYVEMPWGFKRRGFLGRNQIFNSPVQGAAFLCLLWSIIEINKIKTKERWKSSIIGQIHDSILFDIFPEEKDYMIKTCNQIMIENIMKSNLWIKTPFITEWKFSEIDGSWYEMKGGQ